MTCCDAGGGWESRVLQATQRQHRGIRIGLSSVVEWIAESFLLSGFFEWALSSRALGRGEWPGIPRQQAMPRVGRGAKDVPDT
jgi:hypothetical protein